MQRFKRKSKLSLNSLNIGRLLEWGEQELRSTSSTPSLDALLLLAFVCRRKKEFLLTHPEIKPDARVVKKFKRLIRERQKYKPLAYIFKQKEFFGYTFYIDQRVLIPRPETEKIVEEALKYILKRPRKRWKILDIGTGSGCIAISLAKELQKRKVCFKITASDISKQALAVAKINASKLGVKNIQFIQSNLFEKISSRFDIIVANLPYLQTEEISKELSFEPRTALEDKGQIAQLLDQAPSHLKARGVIIYETSKGKIKKISKHNSRRFGGQVLY